MGEGFCNMSKIQRDPPDSASAAGFNECLNPKAIKEEILYLQNNGESPYRETVINYVDETISSWDTLKEKIDSV